MKGVAISGGAAVANQECAGLLVFLLLSRAAASGVWLLPWFCPSEVAIQGGQAGVNCLSVSCCFFSDVVAVSAESSQGTEM